MDFQPKTLIYFSRTGIDDYNKVVCSSQEELREIGAGGTRTVGYMDLCSFQRADGYFTVRVDHSDIPYYTLMQADTLMYLNRDQPEAFWMFCNILSVQWKNEDCSFVTFKIDYFMTYQYLIDWNNTYAYIEREHVKEDWSAAGNPLFQNMGPDEDFGTNPDTPVYTWVKTLKCDKAMVVSPYKQIALDEKNKVGPVFDGTVTGNLYSSLQVFISTPEAVNNFLKDIAESKGASINNVVGVYGLPSEIESAITSGTPYTQNEELPAVHIAASRLPSAPTYHNAKCWASPYYNVRIESSEGDVINFTPQWFGSDTDNFECVYRFLGAGKLFAGAQLTFRNKNGAFNWKAWSDFTVMIHNLPLCPWTGDGYTEWKTINATAGAVKASTILWSGITGAVNKTADFISSGDRNSALGATYDLNNAVSHIADIAASVQQKRASGATINGTGSYAALADVAADCWGFKVVYYGTQLYIMRSIDMYFDRFGYRVNRLKKLEIENRPIWTFIKTAECHVNTISNSGIPFIGELAINSMFNHGVTMWKHDKYISGRKIGDFSNAAENKGIKG